MRNYLLGAAIGVLAHLYRDLAMPPGTGVPLLWPATTRGFHLPRRAWIGAVAILAIRAATPESGTPKHE